MKFSLKLLLCTMIFMAIAFGLSGLYFVNYVFNTALSREVSQALDESSILGFAFETAALNAPAKYDVLPDNTVRQIALNLEAGGRMLRFSDEQKQIIYMSDSFGTDYGLVDQTNEDTRAFRIVKSEGHYYIQVGTTVNALDRVLYLETMKDVSEVFKERGLGFTVYRRVTVTMLIFGTCIMLVISSWLTRPIRLLTRATKRMTAGDYDYRAKVVSNDELGQLTTDFNKMANVLEDNINKLEEELRSREDFVAAFAHELKTPLTAIIGYADMLRSRKMDEEKSFLSANYIYTEGKRLETMSFRLLDIIVTKRQDIQFQMISAESLFYYLCDMYVSNDSMDLVFTCDKGMVRAEADLIKSVLMNLLDNACKASEPGGKIEVEGTLLEKGYRFVVRDHGMGISKEEQSNITKAFYMVDKSRSRNKNGAGLGLALCAEILLLHHSRLVIESVPQQGTCISFVLPHE